MRIGNLCVFGLCVFMVGIAYAETTSTDRKTVASKAYVDTKIETKQLKIPAAGQPNVGAGETVMTYTSTGNGQIGERGLYSDISSYNASTDGDKLITASALNATFTNLPTTPTTKLECANSPACTLWTIVDQTAYAIQLPAGYTRLEYIESTGTQYIDTGYKPNTNTTIKTKTYITANSNTPFGCRWSGAPEYDTFGAIVGSTGQLTVYYGRYSDDKYTPYLSYDKSIVHDIEINMDSVVYDGRSTPITRGSFASTENMYLGAFNNIGEIRNLITGRIYSVEIKESNIMVRNFVPAKRNSDNVIGMYDTVSGNFFTNAATSGPDFTAGPPVQ